jgi:hypothetical protein
VEPYYQGYQAAYALTFDDGLALHFRELKPMLDQPLIVELSLPKNWKGVQITQGETTVKVTVLHGRATADLIPDAGLCGSNEC